MVRKIKFEDCVYCDDDFYNDNNPYGIKECCRFKNSKVITRYKISVNLPMNKRKNYVKVKVPECYKQRGYCYLESITHMVDD